MVIEQVVHSEANILLYMEIGVSEEEDRSNALPPNTLWTWLETVPG